MAVDGGGHWRHRAPHGGPGGGQARQHRRREAGGFPQCRHGGAHPSSGAHRRQDAVHRRRLAPFPHRRVAVGHRALQGQGRVSERAGQAGFRGNPRLFDRHHQHHQGLAAAQSAVFGGAQVLPQPLRSERAVAADRLCRQPHHRVEAGLAGRAGGLRPEKAHGKSAGAAEERARRGAPAVGHPREGRREDERAAARVLPAPAAEGDPEGTGPRQGRQDRRARHLQRAHRQADAARAGEKAHRRGNAQAVAAGNRLAGIHRHPQLSRLADRAAVGRAYAGQDRPRSRTHASSTATTTGWTT